MGKKRETTSGDKTSAFPKQKIVNEIVSPTLNCTYPETHEAEKKASVDKEFIYETRLASSWHKTKSRAQLTQKQFFLLLSFAHVAQIPPRLMMKNRFFGGERKVLLLCCHKNTSDYVAQKFVSFWLLQKWNCSGACDRCLRIEN